MARELSNGENLSEANSFQKTEGTNVFTRAIAHHFRPQEEVKSPEQVEREKWLLPGVRFNRWALFPAAAIIQFCAGSLYAWSVYNTHVDLHIYGEDFGMAPATFYLACGCYGIACATLGPWSERTGPLTACFAGIGLFCSGHFLAALGLYVKQIWLVYIGYGVVGGAGTGLCYLCPVSAVQKWFPDRRGMASGLSVCGFGAGAIVLAKVSIPLMVAVGLPMTFLVLGGFHLVLMSAGALVLRTPPRDYVVNGMRSDGSFVDPPEGHNLDDCSTNDASGKKLTLIECITSKDFRLLFIVMTSNCLFGVCCYSRLSNMVTDIFGRSVHDASTVVAVNGCFNLGGRVFYSTISDLVGRKIAYTIMLTTQLILVALFSTITSAKAYWTFVMSMWIVTTCYGGGWATIAAFLTDKFGPDNSGPCHGVIIMAYSLSGVGGGMVYLTVFNLVVSSGYTSRDPYPYNVNSWWILGVIFIGWVSLIFISPTQKDIQFRAKVRSVFNRVTNGRGSFEVQSSVNL